MIATYRTVKEGWGIIGYTVKSNRRIYMNNGNTSDDPQAIEIFPDQESAGLAINEWAARWAETTENLQIVRVSITIKLGE